MAAIPFETCPSCGAPHVRDLSKPTPGGVERHFACGGVWRDGWDYTGAERWTGWAIECRRIRKAQVAATYDVMFASGGYGGVYNLPYWQSPYYRLNKVVAGELARALVNSVLEVGCGAGHFAKLLNDTRPIPYRGFDFSPIAVAKTNALLGKDAAHVGDATDPANYAGDYQAIVCMEVLEHLPDDLKAVALWPSGKFCVCSVPNFDDATHERFFRHEREVLARYGELIRIQRLYRVKAPVGISATPLGWLKEVRWGLRKPDNLRRLFGLGSFDRDGGWFVFTGHRF